MHGVGEEVNDERRDELHDEPRDLPRHPDTRRSRSRQQRATRYAEASGHAA
jgi:hypothetical protein